jgi:hypothetical protein
VTSIEEEGVQLCKCNDLCSPIRDTVPCFEADPAKNILTRF